MSLNEEWKRSIEWNEWIDVHILQHRSHDRKLSESDIKHQVQQIISSVKHRIAYQWIMEQSTLFNTNDSKIAKLILKCENHTIIHLHRLESNMDRISSYLYEIQCLQVIKTALLETLHEYTEFSMDHLYHHILSFCNQYVTISSSSSSSSSLPQTIFYMEWFIREICVAINDIQHLPPEINSCYRLGGGPDNEVQENITTTCTNNHLSTINTSFNPSINPLINPSINTSINTSITAIPAIHKKKKRDKVDRLLKVKKIVLWGKRKDGRAIANRWSRLTDHHKEWTMGFTRAQLVNRPLGIRKLSIPNG